MFLETKHAMGLKVNVYQFNERPIFILIQQTPLSETKYVSHVESMQL